MGKVAFSSRFRGCLDLRFASDYLIAIPVCNVLIKQIPLLVI